MHAWVVIPPTTDSREREVVPTHRNRGRERKLIADRAKERREFVSEQEKCRAVRGCADHEGREKRSVRFQPA